VLPGEDPTAANPHVETPVAAVEYVETAVGTSG
jgi:hypothetical protein